MFFDDGAANIVLDGLGNRILVTLESFQLILDCILNAYLGDQRHRLMPSNGEILRGSSA